MVQRETLFEVTAMFGTMIKRISQEWNKRGKEYNISFPQFKMLHILERFGSMKVSDIAEKMGLTSAAITGITDKLLTDGLVQRERAEADRRVVYITITEQGKEIIRMVTIDQDESVRTIFDTLEDEDILHLKRIFTAILNNLDK